MARIGKILLPPALNTRLVELLNEIPDPRLEQFGREFLPGGFTRAAAIRKRLAGMIQGDAPLPGWLEGLLIEVIPGKSAVETLSVRFLSKMVGTLAEVLGCENLVLCLLTDEREPVKDLGVTRLDCPLPAPSEGDEETAREFLAELLDLHLLSHLDLTVAPPEAFADDESIAPPGLPEEDWVDPPALAAEGSFPDHALVEQQREIDRLKRYLHDEKRRGKERLREVEEQSKAEHDRVVAEKDGLREKLLAAESEKAAVQKELQDLRSRQEAAIRQGIEHETSFIVRKWLEEPARVEEAAERARQAADDLLAHAEEAIRQQSLHDRHTGNRLEVQKRLAALRNARDRVQDTKLHAIRPVAELDRVLADLEKEINRLEDAIGAWAPDNPSTIRIIEKIHAASRSDELGQAGELIKTLAGNDILSKRDQRHIYSELYRKFSLLEDSSGREAGEEAVEDGWSLRRLIVRNHPVLIMVDGHNVLFGLEEFLGQHFENGYPGAAARNELVQAVSKLMKDCDRAEAIVFFDGPTIETASAAQNVRIEYSGGTGSNRADARIAAELRFKKLEKLGEKCFVVSNDQEVRRDTLRYGARYVPVEAFAVLLADFRCL